MLSMFEERKFSNFTPLLLEYKIKEDDAAPWSFSPQHVCLFSLSIPRFIIRFKFVIQIKEVMLMGEYYITVT